MSEEPVLIPGRPLIVCDADEVLLQFIAGLEAFLPGHGHRLDLTSYALTGNIRRVADDVPATQDEVSALLKQFYTTDGLDLEIVPGAAEALNGLAAHAQIVILTNVAPEAALGRSRNLARHGIEFPVVSNSGGKGKRVREMAEALGAPVVFIDDIAFHHKDVAEAWPGTHHVHFVADPRLFAFSTRSPHANVYTSNWTEAADYIRAALQLR